MRTLTKGMMGLATALVLVACGGDPPRVPFPTAGTTPSGTPVAQPSPVGAATTYTCNQGTLLVVIGSPGAPTLSYSYAGYPQQQMTLTSGTAYTDGTYQLQLQGNQASLAHAGTGQIFDTCTRA